MKTKITRLVCKIVIVVLPILWSFSQHTSATAFSATLAQFITGPCRCKSKYQSSFRNIKGARQNVYTGNFENYNSLPYLDRNSQRGVYRQVESGLETSIPHLHGFTFWC